MNELKLKIGDKVLITNGLPTEDMEKKQKHKNP